MSAPSLPSPFGIGGRWADNPKRSTTEPKVAMGTSDGAKATAATAFRVHWSTAARVQRVPLTNRK